MYYVEHKHHNATSWYRVSRHNSSGKAQEVARRYQRVNGGLARVVDRNGQEVAN